MRSNISHIFVYAFLFKPFVNISNIFVCPRYFILDGLVSSPEDIISGKECDA